MLVNFIVVLAAAAGIVNAVPAYAPPCKVKPTTPISTKAAVEEIVSFGDSLTDNGAGNKITSALGIPFPNSYFNGRLSNGPTYIEVVAEKRKLPLVNNAISGATTNDVVVKGFLGDITIPGGHVLIPGVNTQIASYVAVPEQKAILAKNTTLTTIWSGGNDNFNNANPFFKLGKTGDYFAKPQYDNWVALANAGSTKILTILLARTTPFFNAFGDEIIAQAANFKKNFPNVQLEIYDMGEVFLPIIADPIAAGFEKGPTDVCCVLCSTGLPPVGRATICANPDKWMLYDDIHPTAEMHRRYAAGLDAFIAAKFGY
ncbi:hypothetical protein BC829DRAFT_403590 [Chytridium lagenaria]|nr:hypothetical protein BC829DRAFT_403590 [Chytridium lagenaria]